MDVAVFIVSGLAAVAAVLSWRASIRSAKAAEDSALRVAEVSHIEQERRHEEEAPDWEVSGSESSYGLIEFRIVVRGPAERYSITVEVIEGSVVPVIGKGASDGLNSEDLDLGVVPVGVKERFFGSVVPSADEEQRFLATFKSDGGTWRVYKECKISWARPVH